jgi:hypothetical protein
MPKYRKKPVVIEARQLTWDEADAIAAWCGGRIVDRGSIAHGGIWVDLSIQTLEGEMTARLGDYVIRGIKGEFYPCKSDIFEATYEAVAEGVQP